MTANSLSEETMTCPRCDHDHTTTVAKSPVPDVWDVLQCDRCLYMWRTTEPPRRTTAEHYPAAFRLTLDQIENAPAVPPVPALRADPS